MIGVKAHGWGSRPLNGAAAPLPVLLPVIAVGSLVSSAWKRKR